MELNGKVVGQLVKRVTVIKRGGAEKRNMTARLVQRLIIESRPLEDIGGTDNESAVDMLPIGPWSSSVGDGSCDEKKPSVQEFPIPERFDFLRTLNPREVSGFSSRRLFNYRGFMVGKFIITDNLGYGNAIYLYDGSYGDEWLGEVKRTKSENLSNGGRSFVCRITHHKGWEEKLLAVLRTG